MASQAVISFEDAVRRMDPVEVPAEQREQLDALARVFGHGEVEKEGAFVLRSPSGLEVALPESTVVLLAHIIEVLARGDALTVVPVAKELTTQQAANMLNVSRQYLVRLLDDGRIPSRKTGTHRRVRADDLLAFKRVRDQQRMASLDELTRLTEALGGYDDEFDEEG